MTPRPRLLFISPRFLFPADEGGKIRTSNILRRMKGGRFEIVLASPAPPRAGAYAGDVAAVCDRFVSWPARPASDLRRALALASRLPVGVVGDRSAAGRHAVARAIAEAPDVVVADFPHAAVLTPDRLDPASVLFTHNVEAEIFERHARVATGVWRLIWRDQARKMDAFERATCRRFGTVIAVSARDAAALERRFGPSGVETIDTGVDLEYFRFSPPGEAPDPAPDGGTIVFTGVMDSPANIDGVEFLMREIWPPIAKARPRARALIVGRNPVPALPALARERGLPFEFTGFVEDIRPHVAGAHVSVIPLRVGSGTRIKAFEAMAMGRPVVSTRVGVEGLDIEPGRHFLAADAAGEFAEAILRLLGDAGLRDGLARAARARLEERFSWARVARQFEDICLRAMAAHARRRGQTPGR